MKANAVRWNLYDAANTMSAQVAAASAMDRTQDRADSRQLDRHLPRFTLHT